MQVCGEASPIPYTELLPSRHGLRTQPPDFAAAAAAVHVTSLKIRSVLMPLKSRPASHVPSFGLGPVSSSSLDSSERKQLVKLQLQTGR